MVEQYTYKNVIEYAAMDEQMTKEFYAAVQRFEDDRAQRAAVAQELKIHEPHVITEAVPPKEERGSKFARTGTSFFTADMSPKSSISKEQHEEDKNQANISIDTQKLRGQDLNQENLHIDEATGM